METYPHPFGKYFLLEKIAIGGMAEIYKAKTFGSDGFEKIVVIKKILSHWANDPDFVRMLIDEAKLSVQLNHSNIVAILDLGSVDKDYFIAMEFIEGFDLKTLMQQVLEKGKNFPLDVACYIALQAAAGMDYAHKKMGVDGNPLGIIHRDISPHNILLSYTGDVKITDFGIAKATLKKSFTSTGMLRGKFSYMSPEQVRGENLSSQSDVFSLGIVLYEMLTGQKCFDGDTELSIIDKIRNAQIKIENIPSHLPDSLRTILSKALAADLSARYASADLFQTDLAQSLSHIHPGFLPKDLSFFLQNFKIEKPKIVPSEKISKPPEGTSISYIPGFKSVTSSHPSKKSFSGLWIFLFIFFAGILVGGFLIGKKIIQSRFSASLKPTVTSSPLPAPTKPESTPAAIQSRPRSRPLPENDHSQDQPLRQIPPPKEGLDTLTHGW